MKATNILTITFLPKKWFALPVFCLLLAACSKDKNASLPPETQTSAGTFGCKIDGKVWVPNGSDGYGGNIQSFYQKIYPGTNGYVFNISPTSFDKKPLEFFVIGADSLTIQSGVSYEIGDHPKGEFGASYFIGTSISNAFNVVRPLTGQILFTRFDNSSQIASGTFWFDAKNASGDVIHASEGRFDVKYTR